MGLKFKARRYAATALMKIGEETDRLQTFPLQPQNNSKWSRTVQNTLATIPESAAYTKCAPISISLNMNTNNTNNTALTYQKFWPPLKHSQG